MAVPERVFYCQNIVSCHQTITLMDSSRLSNFLLTVFFAGLNVLGCKGQSASPMVNNLPDGPPAGKPPVDISWTDKSPGWKLNGPKLLITGIVFKSDGRTPAPNVVVYYYHTNTEGRYVHIPEEPQSMPPNAQGQTHGHIRGWVKTGANGVYEIYTIRPGKYPRFEEPAHIHLTVQEPDQKEYYIDDVVFDDDPLLTTPKRLKMENRGGTGVVRLVKKDDLFIGERNIILGLHIPGYAASSEQGITSGRSIGEDVFSFIPIHAWGPDKGSKACPVCKYGQFHGILYFVGNHPNWSEIRKWLTFFEAESIRRGKYLKVYFVYGKADHQGPTDQNATLAALGAELNIQHVALTYVPSFHDEASDVIHNKINPEVESTFILFKRRNIFDKYINLKPTETNFEQIINRLEASKNAYFGLE